MLSRAKRILELSLSRNVDRPKKKTSFKFRNVFQPSPHLAATPGCLVPNSPERSATNPQSKESYPKRQSVPDLQSILDLHDISNQEVIIACAPNIEISAPEYTLAEPSPIEPLSVTLLDVIAETNEDNSISEITNKSADEFANVNIYEYSVIDNVDMNIGMSLEVNTSDQFIPHSSPFSKNENEDQPEILQEVLLNPNDIPLEFTDHSYLNLGKKPHGNKRTVSRDLRVKGLSYIGFKRFKDGKMVHNTERVARSVKERCKHTNIESTTARTLLCATISEEVRLKQHEYMWSLPTWEAKQAYIKGLVTTRQPLRRRPGKENQTASRRESHDCYLPQDTGGKVLVCREMFMSTFDIGETMFRRWVKDEILHINQCGCVQQEEDVPLPDINSLQSQRKLRKAKLDEWLDILPKVPSHYCRASSDRVYVESVFRSYMHMYSTYKEWCQDNGIGSVCRQIFCDLLAERKIAIHSPRKDQCDKCTSYDVGHMDKKAYAIHIEKKNEARHAKQKAKEMAGEPSKLVVTMDAQSVLLAPKLSASAAYYKQKLQMHNFTIYDLHTGHVILYVWHEGNGGYGAQEFTSCITDFIKDQVESYTHFTLISDGCGYQNKNKTLSSALSDLAKTSNITIEHLYLEPGHTMMEVDSVHSTLESVFTSPVYAPSDYLSRMKVARKGHPYNIKSLDYTFFRNFEVETNFKSIRPGNRVGDPTVMDIRALRYTESGIEYKQRHPQEWQPLPQRRSGHHIGERPAMYTKPTEIRKEKFDDLQTLKVLIPSEYHSFYDTLHHT